METLNRQRDARKYAIIALIVFVLSEVVFSTLSFLTRDQSYTYIAFTNAIATVFTRWIPPFIISREEASPPWD